ncbi:MAG: putative transposase [Bryobacterales bacterium]|nr:putative transposase [Bryobacterales bacterium]
MPASSSEIYEAVLSLSRLIAGMTDLDALLSGVGQALRRIVKFDHLGMVLHDADSECMVGHIVTEPQQAPRTRRDSRFLPGLHDPGYVPLQWRPRLRRRTGQASINGASGAESAVAGAASTDHTGLWRLAGQSKRGAKGARIAAYGGKWRARFLKARLEGLYDEPRPGAPRKVSDEQVEKVIIQTLESTPQGQTHWSTRRLAEAADSAG